MTQRIEILLSCFLLLGLPCSPGQGRGTPEELQKKDDQEKIKRLFLKAINAPEPEERVKLSKEILELDSEHAGAIQLLQRSEEDLKKKDIEAKQAGEAKRDAQKKEQQAGEAAAEGEKAVAEGDAAKARKHMERVRSLMPNHPSLDRLNSGVSALDSQIDRFRMLLFGGGVGAAALIAVIIVWLRREKHPYLVVGNGTLKGEEIPVEGDILRMGAVEGQGDRKNDCWFPDNRGLLSRFHCELIRKSGRLFIKDLDSTNGVFLNDRRIKPAVEVPLSGNTRIDLGRAVVLHLRFRRRK